MERWKPFVDRLLGYRKRRETPSPMLYGADDRPAPPSEALRSRWRGFKGAFKAAVVLFGLGLLAAFLWQTMDEELAGFSRKMLAGAMPAALRVFGVLEEKIGWVRLALYFFGVPVVATLIDQRLGALSLRAFIGVLALILIYGFLVSSYDVSTTKASDASNIARAEAHREFGQELERIRQSYKDMDRIVGYLGEHVYEWHTAEIQFFGRGADLTVGACPSDHCLKVKIEKEGVSVSPEHGPFARFSFQGSWGPLKTERDISIVPALLLKKGCYFSLDSGYSGERARRAQFVVIDDSMTSAKIVFAVLPGAYAMLQTDAGQGPDSIGWSKECEITPSASRTPPAPS